jgi:hypothetical protein
VDFQNNINYLNIYAIIIIIIIIIIITREVHSRTGYEGAEGE